MTWLVNETERLKDRSELVSVFGVVLFTDRHANVVKLLRDEDYWKSFHERSGSAWAILATRVLSGEYELPNFPPGTNCMMIPVWKEPMANKAILKQFGLDDSQDAPCLVIFAELEDGALLINKFKIKDDTVDSAYQSLGGVIDAVASGLSQVRSENLSNQEGVFTAMNVALKSHSEWKWIENKVPLAQWLISLGA